MRLRKNHSLTEAIKDYEDIVFLRGQTGGALQSAGRLEVEIGAGRGGFLAQLAAARPMSFFVGIDSKTEVLCRAAKQLKEKKIANARLIEGDAAGIDDWFTPGQVSALYINFCDPWPKARHAKRRLVSRAFLAKYRKVAAIGGALYFKTDNGPLFAFALEEFSFCGLKVIRKTVDLHKSDFVNPGWTEYERKFHRLGMPVCFCEAMF